MNLGLQVRGVAQHGLLYNAQPLQRTQSKMPLHSLPSSAHGSYCPHLHPSARRE